MFESNNVDVSVYQGEVHQKSCGSLQLTDRLEQSDQIYTLICEDAGDTVKLSKTSDKIDKIEVFEIVVLSDTFTGKNCGRKSENFKEKALIFRDVSVGLLAGVHGLTS